MNHTFWLALLAVTPLLLLAAKIGVGLWIDSGPAGREQGQVLADLLEAAEPFVEAAERLPIPGPDKAAQVRDWLEAALREKGIEGSAARVYERHIPAIIELALARALPKQAS